MSLNLCQFIGNVGKEPVISVSKDGKEYATFSIAVSRDYNKEEVDWVNCVIYGEVCTKLIKPFVHKGSPVYVSGSLAFSNYEKDGVNKTSSSIRLSKIQLLGSSNNSQGEAETETSNNNEPDTPKKFEPIEDSQLPF